MDDTRLRSIAYLLCNYLVAGHLCLASESVNEERESSVGFRHADDALAALHMKPNVDWRTAEDGWIVAHEEGASVVWAFAPKSDPSYPSAVRRSLLRVGTDVKVGTDILCEASKEKCDYLARYFQTRGENLLREFMAHVDKPNN